MDEQVQSNCTFTPKLCYDAGHVSKRILRQNVDVVNRATFTILLRFFLKPDLDALYLLLYTYLMQS